MGSDNQPKHRQKAREVRRAQASRQSYERLLIVCEGSKTEPSYFNEIRKQFRIATANVEVQPSEWGTDPLNIVRYAEHLFVHGSRPKGIRPRSFDKIYAVFDRDSHQNYHQALAFATARSNVHANEEGAQVPFIAVASVPCFEAWLLMHFEDVVAPVHRDEVYQRLRQHIVGYEKGQGNLWEITRGQFEQAVTRARLRQAVATPFDGNEVYTDVHELVEVLLALRQ